MSKRMHAQVVVCFVIISGCGRDEGVSRAKLDALDGGVAGPRDAPENAPPGSWQISLASAASASMAAIEPKTAICHRPPDNPVRSHTLFVSPSALESHVSHGDLVGECPKTTKAEDVISMHGAAATAVAVVRSDSAVSRAVTEYPGVITDINLTVISDLKGAAPTHYVRVGGTVGDVSVHDAESIHLPIGSSSLAFFDSGGKFGVRMIFALAVDGQTIELYGERFTVGQVAAILNRSSR